MLLIVIINNKHVKCGGNQFLVHFCLLWSAMIGHAFIPFDFCLGVIVSLSLLKDKQDDASKIEMYYVENI